MANINFKNVYIKDSYIVVGPKELKSKIISCDATISYYNNSKTFELAEVKMQRMVVEGLLNKNKLSDEKIDYLIGGDLINQISISSYNAKDFRIPFLGVYSACATFCEELILGGNLIDSKNAKNVICVTSSHNLTAERQFRYPIEYGNVKPKTATNTATASVGVILSNKKTKYRIVSATVGKVIEMGINDVNHMGAVMAPACADTLHEHLLSIGEKTSFYDLILTGDLGSVGLEILKEYYEKEFDEKILNIKDAGSELYFDYQDMDAGGSGPCCLPLMLFGKFIKNKKYKRILILGTGSLHSTVFVNQHQMIPSISHAVAIEVVE